MGVELKQLGTYWNGDYDYLDEEHNRSFFDSSFKCFSTIGAVFSLFIRNYPDALQWRS
jgi:hypothetical protein